MLDAQYILYQIVSRPVPLESHYYCCTDTGQCNSVSLYAFVDLFLPGASTITLTFEIIHSNYLIAAIDLFFMSL